MPRPMHAPQDTSGSLLRTTGIVKTFPGVRALDGVDLEVLPGEVHCLLGQNGAGKSTLIKVLSGTHAPDEGHIDWDGERVTFTTPAEAMAAGVATMYQELDLVDGLTVAENIFLGHELSFGGVVRAVQTRRKAAEILSRLGHSEIRPGMEVGRLAPAGKQVVSMARALSRDARLLIMDEPSAVLDQEEVANLFRVIEQVSARGVAIVYISHRLEEIQQIGDRITVLKDGRSVASGLEVAATPTADLIQLMTGREIEYTFAERAARDPQAKVVVQVEGLSDGVVFDEVSFQVRAGEVLGLVGLVGAGRSEILETLYGARRASAGTVRVDGRALRRGSVDAAVRAGIGLCPEERKSQGLLLDASVADNMTLASLPRLSRGGYLDRRRERKEAQRMSTALDVRPSGTARPARNLSGGNQQKVLLARWLLRECRVLLLDEPTRGVDVGARSEIYALIRELVSRGVAVVVVSSEVDEVLGLSDRVLVIREGTVVHEGAAEAIDEHAVLDLVMTGSAA